MRLPLLCVGALIINRLKAPSDLISCRIGGHRAALGWLQGQPTPLSSIHHCVPLFANALLREGVGSGSAAPRH